MLTVPIGMWWQDTPQRLVAASATAGAREPRRPRGRGLRAGQATGRRLLELLAGELARQGDGQALACRLRRDWRGRPHLLVIARGGRRRLRVHAASLAGRHALITSSGDVIGVADLPAAARAVASAARAGDG